MSTMQRKRSSEAFFGRRRGKALRSHQQAALERGLADRRLDLETPAPCNLATLFNVPVRTIRLEIGFGGGEHLLHETGRFSDIGFIGVEPFINGMAKLMAALQATPRGNLLVYDDDATRLLDWLPPESLAGIDLLYPDPWPKKKHWKRRFVSAGNLDRFARVLQPGGRFRFASDIDSYVNWTLRHCRAHADFSWQAMSAEDWQIPYQGWPGTRYEKKALREGRRATYLTFMRR